MHAKPINILLVEDDEEDYIITRNLLRQTRGNAFKIDWMPDYQMARQAIAGDDYDVYLLDYHLGRNNGIELLEEAILNGCKKPLIMLTGKGNSEIDARALRSGAADFLNKGKIDAALLERSIRYSMQQKRVEGELDAEKERLAVTLRSIGDGVITTDYLGRIELVNKTAEKLTGWSGAEAAHKSIEEIFRVMDDKTHKKIENPVLVVLKSRRSSDIFEHIILVSQDGKEHNIIASAAPISDKNNKIIGVVLVFRAITELLQVQAELQKTQKLESLGVLSGGIAHDFNNLLTIIVGNVELAKIGIDSKSEVLECLDLINTAAQRAKELTAKFITFAKGVKPTKKTLAIIKFVKESVDLCLSGSNIKCEFSFQDDLANVDIDEVQISQVFNNLILNAKQAMLKGGKIKILAENISIPAKNTLHLKKGEYIKISIKDNGKGISKENMVKIFDPYFTTKKMGNTKGTGLGLSTTYAIIKNHNGLITVDSKLNLGTTFFIYLPASSGKMQINLPQTNSFKIHKKKILLLDDNTMLREVVIRILTNIGHEVIATGEGEEAINLVKSAKAANDKFEVVILDLTLPGGPGGNDLIQQIRAIDPEVKAVISSGYLNHPVMTNFKNYGFDAAICKPYRISELSETLTNI